MGHGTGGEGLSTSLAISYYKWLVVNIRIVLPSAKVAVPDEIRPWNVFWEGSECNFCSSMFDNADASYFR